MRQPLPSRRLTAHPDLDQLKRQAKELRHAYLAGMANAVAEVGMFHPDAGTASFALHDAQLVLARSYGFDSWPKLKAFVDGVTVDRLIAAVRADDTDAVRAVLGVRPELVNVSARGPEEHTALHEAVFARQTRMVRLLVELGADPHAGIGPLSAATSALTIASDRGYDEIVDAIRGAEKIRVAGRATAADVPGELRLALDAHDEERTIAILEQHPRLLDFRVPNGGWTLLHLASARLLERVTTWLLDRGADVNAAADDQSSPLDVLGMLSFAPDKPTRIATLARQLRARGAAVGPRAAVILGDDAALRDWHARGKLTVAQDDRGWLLRLAVDSARPDTLALLLGLGLDPDARARVDGVDAVEFTWGMPLYAAVRAGRHDMAEMLLARGADANAQVYASGTPLSEAFGQRDERMVALLQRYGGQPNASMAGLYRRLDLAQLLLDRHGDTPLPDDGFAAGPVAEQLVGAAARGGDPAILALALKRVDWPAGDPRWYGALTAPLGFWNHWTGPWCHPEWDRTTYLTCFQMLLDRVGAPVARGRFGTTILHGIVTMGEHVTPDERVAFATAALAAGAPTSVRDDLLKSTPLGWASRWDRIELVRLFLDRGVDPIEVDIAEGESWTAPLAWAEKKGHHEIAALLRRTIMNAEC